MTLPHRDPITGDTASGDLRNALQAVAWLAEGTMPLEDALTTMLPRLRSALWKIERLRELARDQSPTVTHRRVLEVL